MSEMGPRGFSVVAFLVALASVPGGAAGQVDRIYGRVTTAAGRTYEGPIRWDLNEGGWADLLNGSKDLSYELLEDGEELRTSETRTRTRSVEFLGVRISWDDEPEEDWPSSAQSGIRFGHLRSLTVVDDDRARLELKSGQTVEMSGGSTDLGEDLRGLVVEDPERGTVELLWRDLDRVDFTAGPPVVGGPEARRLHGTLEDRWGNEYTGYVAWDLDEVLTSDVLDGEEDGRRREIPFGNVAAIERYGPDAARVTLASGEELVLSASNDVNDDNRGIQVADPGLGQVQVGWDDFEAVRFHDPARPTEYAEFDGGTRLRGTVVTEEGESFSGLIRWDNDEAYTWEILDGEFRGVVYDIELGLVTRIAKRSSRSADVTLKDGRTFELENSNDVDRNNKGIFIELEDGSVVLVDWYDFSQIVFEGS